MSTSGTWGIAVGCGLALMGCSTPSQSVKSPPEAGRPGSLGVEAGTVAPVPVLLHLPPPSEPVLAAQKALPLVPGALVRTGDGRLFSTKDGAELVLVPQEGFSAFSRDVDLAIEGEFTMGDDSSTEADEKPAHRVSLSVYFLDRHEVTNAQFARFVAETGYRTDAEEQGTAHALVGDSFVDIQGADWRHPGGPGTSIEGMDAHPVVLVSWNDAKGYCDWAGRRLPTEAEFERALRAGSEGARYPWENGDVPPRGFANLSDETAKRAHGKWVAIPGYEDGFAGTAPVGSFPQNDLGLFDVCGNVWEWCADWYGPYVGGPSPTWNPRGTDTGERRVYRGGGWDCDLFGARCSCRDNGKPGLRLPYLGFRAAMRVK